MLFCMSTKQGGVSDEPYCLNLSYSTGDKEDDVRKNREIFFRKIGISEEQVTFQKQIHSTNIKYSERGQFIKDCDAIYTNKNDVFLAVSTADCIPVFLYEPGRRVVAAIHSGWRGTAGKIVTKTIEEMVKRFDINVSEVIAYIGPGISVRNYEVGREVAKYFGEDVRMENQGRYYVDLKRDNYGQLRNAGIPQRNIEVNEMCTFKERELLHSYRRDGEKSGRMMGIIGIRGAP